MLLLAHVVFFYDFANRFVKLKWQAASHKLMPKRPGVFFYDFAATACINLCFFKNNIGCKIKSVDVDGQRNRERIRLLGR